MDRCYLVQYGLNSQVGRFSTGADDQFERGEAVVIRSWRGTELGEVLIEAGRFSNGEPVESAVEGIARILRSANHDDLDRARIAETLRDPQFEACSLLFQDGTWPIELIDVEPLLDDRRTVLHYLGPHKLDTAGLLAVFRNTCNLDVMFQPAGTDVADVAEEADVEEPAPEAHGCGSCGSKSGGGCGTGGGGGCGSCAVKKLMKPRP